MAYSPHGPNAIAALCVAGVTLACPARAAEAEAGASTPVVIITGSRAEHDSADFLAAIDVIGAAQIGHRWRHQSRFLRSGTRPAVDGWLRHGISLLIMKR